MAKFRRYSECGYLRIGLVRRSHPSDIQFCLNQGSSGCYRQKNTRKGVSWSARAASRWILDKLKEDKERKVLRVQTSDETLEGSGSKDLVSGPSMAIRSILSGVLWLMDISNSLSNQTEIRKMTSRSGTAVDTSDEIPRTLFFSSAGT